LKHFAEVSLSPEEKELLAILAFYSPLPLRILSEVFHHQATVIDDILTRLIDLAFVVTTSEGFYRIADPIADVALRSFGYPDRAVHRTVAEKLEYLLNEPGMAGPRLDLSRALFRAASLAQESKLADRAVHLANDLIQLTESLYHQRNYRQAIETGLLALDQRPTSYKARSFLIRALIQEEQYEQAEKQLQRFQTHAPLRDVYFLRGFLERKRGAIPAAIDAYHESENLGRDDAAISRELALCYLLNGPLDLAATYISEALKKHSDNPYVVDLSAQIATRQKDETRARQALEQLHLIGKTVYYYHRLSRIELAFGRIPDARAAAQRAVDSEDAPPFEALAQLAYCEIESGSLRDAAKVLSRLEQTFGNVRSDVRVGLRCRLEIARKNFGDALDQSERIKGKQSVFYKKIRRDAMQGKLTYSALDDSERANYEAEIAELDRDLSEITAEQFLPAELTIVDISD
jgi:tetratricopeptide (TPR) repeat protein